MQREEQEVTDTYYYEAQSVIEINELVPVAMPYENDMERIADRGVFKEH